VNRRTFLKTMGMLTAASSVDIRALIAAVETRVFAATGAKWYKVLVHSHSRDFSDGALSASQVIKTAKKMGYAALIQTDHLKGIYDKGGRTPEAFEKYRRAFASQDGLIIIPGAEIDTATAHILALGDIPYDAELLRLYDQPNAQQAVIDRLNQLGLIPVAAHPSAREYLVPKSGKGKLTDWRLDWGQVEGLVGVEIFNDGDFYSETIQHYVQQALGGANWFVTAGCDQHGVINPALDSRWQRATWVWVEGSLTKQSLLEAIRQGQTYAAQGVKLTFLNRPPGQELRLVKWLGLKYDYAFDKVPKKSWRLRIYRRGKTVDDPMPAGTQPNGFSLREEDTGRKPEGDYRYVVEFEGKLITSPINLALKYPAE